jgi:hypothetical protein
MKRFSTMGVVGAMSLLVLVSGCSKTSTRANPCDLLRLSETQSLDGTITKAQWFPPKKGETDELCVYEDTNAEPRLMLFVWRDKSSDPVNRVRSGMKSVNDKIIEVSGIGGKAAAGFSVSEGEVLKLFAAESRGGTIGIRVRDPVKEGDEKFNTVKTLAATALGRLK